MHNLAECTSMHQEVFFTWPLWANSNTHWQLKAIITFHSEQHATVNNYFIFHISST